MFDIALKAILFFSITTYASGVTAHKFELMFLQFAVITLFCISLFCKKIRNLEKKEIIFIIFVLVSPLIGIIWNRFNSFSVASYAILFFCVSFGILIFQYSKQPEKCFKWLIWGAFANISFMFLQRYAGINVFIPTNHLGVHFVSESGGMIGSAPRLAMLLTLMLPFMNIWIGLFFIGICCFIKEFSILILCVFIPFSFLKKRREKIIYSVFLLLLCSLGIFLFKKYLFAAFFIRWHEWRPAIIAIVQNPAGVGLGGYPVLSNGFLQIIYMTGFAGIALFVYIFKEFFRKFILNKETLGIIAIFSLMSFEYLLETIRLWPLIITVITFYFIKQKEAEVC